MSTLDVTQLSEPGRRRSAPLDGPWIRLRNGQVWQLARPVVAWGVASEEERSLRRVYPRFDLGRNWSDNPATETVHESIYALFLMELRHGLPDQGVLEFYKGKGVTLAYALLVRNYRLSAEEADALLTPQPEDGDEESAALVREVLLAAVIGPGRELASALQRFVQGDPSRN